MTDRLFTVEEAQALVPHLERTFDEIESLKAELDRHMDRLKILDALWGSAVREPGNPDREEFLAGRAAVRRTVERIEGMVEERIIARGIRFPQGGLEYGLVDFPVRLEGRTVYLCWRSGEDRIVAWHEVDAGYVGRRPLTEDVARRMDDASADESDDGDAVAT